MNALQITVLIYAAIGFVMWPAMFIGFLLNCPAKDGSYEILSNAFISMVSAAFWPVTCIAYLYFDAAKDLKAKLK